MILLVKNIQHLPYDLVFSPPFFLSGNFFLIAPFPDHVQMTSNATNRRMFACVTIIEIKVLFPRCTRVNGANDTR